MSDALHALAGIAGLLALAWLASEKRTAVPWRAIVAGLFVGSLAYALATRRFRLESFTSAADLGNHLAGAVLMGFGGVTAMGCTVGQGLSGVSTLALGSVLVSAAIVAGSAATMKWLYWRMA